MTDMPSQTAASAAPDADVRQTEKSAPKLTRSIGVVGGTLLTLSCLTPASSLFVIVPDSFATLGTGAALTIAIAAVLCIGVAFTYSELGTLIPSSGGEYAMVGTLMGRLAGWLVFILSLIVVMIVPPIIALGTADYLAPIVHLDPQWTAAGVMLLATVMGLLDLRANAWITGIFLVLEVVACAVVAFLGFTHTHRSASVLVHPVMDAGHGHSTPVTAGLIIAGLATALFILQGFSTAVYLAEEMENPRRNVSRTVLWTLAIGAAVVMIPVVAITLGAPDLKTLGAGDVAGMVQSWSNSSIGTFVSLCIALAIINAAIVMVIQNSRVVFSSARDAAWPTSVNRAFSHVSKRFNSPWVATLVVGVPGAVLCFVNLDTLSEVTGVAVAAMYVFVALGALVSRRGAHKHRAAWRMPLWPAIPALLVLVLVWVLWQQSTKSLLITGFIVAGAAVYWAVYLRPRQSTHWVISVPEDEQAPTEETALSPVNA
ncbi:APC family permease [Streptomyces gilvosporeus]|uniref:Amino acid permease n=1 Tax=Streptomyces gilvosporeus TaxID=553510 RepID=A0A1V0U1L9_9ACTN|nr:APC family permease [Streptomyces gilvosporeus]ARF59051.1 amino acid permease [Streptomyces gilvosporeus]